MSRRRNHRARTATAFDQPLLRLREPADVIAAIPFMLGYHPQECVVVLGVLTRDRAFTAHYQLPPSGAARRAIQATIDHLVTAVTQQAPTRVVVVGYGIEGQVTPVVTSLRAAYIRAGVPVMEMLRVHESKYWSYVCTNERCCPSSGTPYDSSVSPVAAAWTLTGRAALSDRRAYEAQIDPVGDEDRAAMRAAMERADLRMRHLVTDPFDEHATQRSVNEAGRRAIALAMTRHRDGGRLTDDEMAWLTLLLASTDVVDVAVAHILDADPDLDALRTLWMDALRRAQPDLVAGPGFLFGMTAWRCGEVSLARIALERVLDEDPDYGRAQELARMLLTSEPPGFEEPKQRQRVKRGGDPRRRKRSSSRRAGSRRR